MTQFILAISLRGYLPLIRKDSSTHMHDLAFYVKEGLPFARDVSLENSADSYFVFDWLYFSQCLTSFPDCDCHSPPLLDLFISSGISICSTMAFPPLGNSDHVAFSLSIGFPSNSQRDAPFHRIAYDYSRANWGGLCDHLRNARCCC